MTAKAGRADVYRAGKQCPLYFERWEVPQFPGVQTVGEGTKKRMKQEKKLRELGERAGKSAARVSKSLFYVAPWNLILKNRLPTLDHLSTQIILLIHCHKSDCVLD